MNGARDICPGNKSFKMFNREVKWEIGCSGFHYKEWKDNFYPKGLPPTKWFEYYSSRFNCLELNSTFYRVPKVSALRNSYDRSPPNFCFSVKAPQSVTHFKRFNDCKDLLSEFYDTILMGLGDKLGPVLFQLPPSCVFSDETLDRIIINMDENFKNVIEFRNKSWWNDSVYKKLSDNNITFCSVSHPKLPEEIINNTELLYYRLHGVPVMFKSEYSFDFLSHLFKNFQNKKASEVFILFNNTWGIAGIINAQQMQSLLINK